MSQFEPAPPTLATTRAPADRLTRLLRPRLLRMLDKLEGGSLTVLEGRERHVLGKGGARNVTLRIHDSRAWRRMALGGTVAAAEAAIGLAILVVFYRNRASIAVDDVNNMKG